MKLTDIKGIGRKKEESLKSLGICSIEDLIYYLPYRYEDRSKLTEVTQAIDETKHYFELQTINTPKTYFYAKNKSITRLRAFDNSSEVNIVWYNDRFTARSIQANTIYKYYGLYDAEKNAIINPIISKITDLSIGGISPIYKSVKGISNKEIIKYKDNLFEKELYLDEYLSESIIRKYSLFNLDEMLKNLHRPSDNLSLYKALYTYNFRNIFLDKLANKIYMQTMDQDHIQFSNIDLASIINGLDFELTRSQKYAIDEIISDMTSAKRMNRILIGDVGSGKTIVAILSALLAIKNGYQVAFMAPTEILAIQHFEKYKKFIESLDFTPSLLTGSSKTNTKNTVYNDLKSGDIDIIFGTHSLFQEKISFNNLGLIITDEQQRFGVFQRKKLADKGLYPDILLMSATPIPRTLALSFYNNLDITFMEGLPKNRLPIKSFLTSIYKEKDFIDFAKNQVDMGYQVYCVVSRVEEDENLESVDRLYDKLNKYFKGSVKLDKLHGSLSHEEKETVQYKFASGAIDILVATSIIEVGIDVPNANTIIIYDANQFGLSQLHQIRGRVGRSSIQSYCFFVLNDRIVQNEKLEFITNTLDGFEIAKKDLEIRGQGDIYGKSQSGFIEVDNPFTYNEEMLKNINKLVDDTDDINPTLSKIIDKKLKLLNEIILN